MTTFDRTVIKAQPAGLTLYLVIPRAGSERILTLASFKLADTVHHHKQWIASRECKRDAINSQIQETGDITKDSHVALKICLTALGVAHFVATFQGRDQGYQCMLRKKCYEDKIDYKVWYFAVDLPLQAVDGHGNPLVSTEIVPID